MTNWKYTINLKDTWGKAQEGEGSVNEVVTSFLSQVKDVQERLPYDSQIATAVDQLEYMLEEAVQAEEDIDGDDFDEVWCDVYDWADRNKVWLQTF